MNIGTLIIGDEILSGKHQDKHFQHVQQLLKQRGLELSWSMVVGDDPIQLERAMRFANDSDDLVFSFGGIGATPDDRTRQTIALVKGLAITPHPEAVQEIEAQYGERAYPNRILMGHLPEGSRIIPNPINRVPGFSLGDMHFMPGFPEMAWPMCEWVLDTLYPTFREQAPAFERVIKIIQGRESDLLETMNYISTEFPSLLLSSLPTIGESPFIEFTLRGHQTEVEKAMLMMIETIERLGYSWQEYQ